MSANHDHKNDFRVFNPNGAWHNDDLEQINKLFDSICDVDVEEISKRIKNIKMLKGACLVKIFEFPLTWTLTRVIMGKKWAEIKTTETKLCYKFLRNKISYDDFNIKYYRIQQKSVEE